MIPLHIILYFYISQQLFNPFHIMKKTLLLFFLLFSGFVYSQSVYNNYDQNKWRVGGGVAMNFGSHGYFGLNISPFIGYEIIQNLEGGLSTGYQFSKYNDVKQNLFSIGPYMNFYPTQFLFARAHYEYYTGSTKFKHIEQKGSFDESALWIGGGYRSGGRIQFYAGIMYNVLYKENESLFAEAYQPIVGVSFGL